MRDIELIVENRPNSGVRSMRWMAHTENWPNHKVAEDSVCGYGSTSDKAIANWKRDYRKEAAKPATFRVTVTV